MCVGDIESITIEPNKKLINKTRRKDFKEQIDLKFEIKENSYLKLSIY